jgi:hypothetical protein
MDSNINTGATDELTRVFVSYAREDKKWLDRDYRFNLIPFLIESLKKQNVVFWYDKELRPGDEFRQHIEAEIDQAQIALLIVSQAFLNSEFIEQHEMSRIANRARLGQMIIVPVLVEPCDWSEYPILADRQMVPGAMPLIDFTESDPKWAKVKSEILDGIKTQIKRIRAAQTQKDQKPPVGEFPSREVQPILEVPPPAPKPTPEPPAAHPSVPAFEPPKHDRQTIPKWVWIAAPLLLIAIFAVVRLATPHSQPAPSSVATPPETPQQTQPASSPANSPNQATQPSAQQAPVQTPAVHAVPSAQNAVPNALKLQADAYFDQSRYSQAAALYDRLCRTGGGASCNRIGYQYENGLGVSRDAAQAATRFSRSCDLGFPNGCSNLGNLYRQGLGVPRNLTLARQLLTKGCSAGNQFGCDKLRLMP